MLVAAAAGVARAEVGASAAATSEWVRTDQTQVRLLSAVAATGEAATVRLGLEFKLEPGWKVYWRSPGDAGLPPKPDWAGSRNLADATIRWPAPERFELFGFDTFGYENDIILPIDARLEHPGEALNLKLGVDYLVCEKICIPYQAAFTLDIPSGAARASTFAHAIDQFAARVPGDGSGAGLAIERAYWSGGVEPAITVAATAAAPFAHPDVFVEGPVPSGISFGKPDVTLSDGGRHAVLRLPARFEDAKAAANAPSYVGSPVTLTLVDGARAMEKELALEAGLPPPAPRSIGLAAVLAAALIGGLILNLMPCVLPVVSLKLLYLVNHAGAARARVRRNFLASAAGILTAFLLLAATLAALKIAGATIGWGIQFQQPEFLIVMALILTLFTANLWGWFEVQLPGTVADAVTATGGPVAADEEGALAAFLSGAFATLLATPCSAPFVGTAVGFALARGPAEILGIFLVLGLGLALPYLAIAAVPGLASRLPRPGRWMLRLRVLLGVALAGTALWLLSVLAVQIGALGGAVLAVLLVAVLIVLWTMRFAERSWRRLGWIAVVGLALVAFATPARFSTNPAETVGGGKLAADAWRPFSLGEIESLVRDGHVVFVDVTADWCLTCQVNKAVVVSRGEVAARLGDGRVVPMRADWTRPNDAIADYLASFGRYGIPFNVVYGPAAPAGIPLPEILTSDAVLAAMDKAKGGKTTAAIP